MKKLAILAFALVTLSRCAATVPLAAAADDAAAKRLEPSPAAAQIFVVRKPQAFGKAILFRVAIDERFLGGLGPGTYRVAEVAPGKHVVAVSGNENEEQREIVAEAGNQYFVVVHARTGLVTARVGLDPE